MSDKKWGNYTQEFDFAPDAEEIKNVQEILDRPRSCTDFSPAARYAVQMLLKYAREEHSQHLKFESDSFELIADCAMYEEMLMRKDKMIDALRQEISFLRDSLLDGAQ